MFEFTGHGTREGIIKAIREKQLPEASVSQANDPKEKARRERAAAQMEAFKEFVIAEINALPTQLNGARVAASASFNPQSSTASLNVIGEVIHV